MYVHTCQFTYLDTSKLCILGFKYLINITKIRWILLKQSQWNWHILQKYYISFNKSYLIINKFIRKKVWRMHFLFAFLYLLLAQYSVSTYEEKKWKKKLLTLTNKVNQIQKTVALRHIVFLQKNATVSLLRDINRSNMIIFYRYYLISTKC